MPTKGDPLVLKIGIFEAFASVRWVRGAQCGIQFDNPLTEELVEKVRGEAKLLMSSPVYLESMLALEDWNTGLAR